MRTRDAERFWGKVDLQGPGDCWIWDGRVDKDGYGKFGVEGKSVRSHRVAADLAGMDLSTGLWVLHSCDNPPCCNPAHLFLGTVVDNNADRKAKGRTTHGNGPPCAKLSHDQVRTMRVARSAGAPLRDLAVTYGVSDAAVSLACNRKTWANV